MLACRPGSIRKAESVGSWLHGVAYRVAMRAIKNNRKRQKHECQAPDVRAQPTSELAWRELQAILDEEVRRLPEKYRAPFVLCCLEGRTREEVKSELRRNEGTYPAASFAGGGSCRTRKRLSGPKDLGWLVPRRLDIQDSHFRLREVDFDE